jgi:membrane protein implicated in regulation of membrane protease activity
MTWADFYLICFAVGFLFSFLAFLLGGIHWHLPFDIHVGNGAHVHVGGNGVHGAGAHNGAHGGDVSPFNPATLAAFLAWFGGTGYLLERFSTLTFVVGLTLAMIAGLAGAGIIFVFLTKVLMAKDEDLDPADFEMVGVLGRISSPIREGGTGELTYSQAGTRRSCGARSEDGRAIAQGEEAVVTRYEKGIAYVRRWEELTRDEDSDRLPADEPETR